MLIPPFRRRWYPHLRLLVLVLALTFFPMTTSLGADSIPIDKIKLPPGFQIEIFSDQVPGARSMTLSPKGTLFVGTRHTGKVYALVDGNGDHKADQVYEIASGLTQPNGVAFRNGALYVAEVNRILRFDGVEGRLKNPPRPVVLPAKLPTQKRHSWKYLAFGPDGKLYVSIGAPCNICENEDPHATIARMNPDGSGFEVFARGVRNSVGFAWHPVTQALWFTDNGRDWLGEDLPPDELNRAVAPGLNFGFPYCYGDNVPDPKMEKTKEFCQSFVAPAQLLGPHVAALGMRFYTGKMFPEAYRQQIFLAEHGSWNRDKKIGYQLSLVKLEGDQAVAYLPFATGWLHGVSHWGRPVDVQVMPDGALLVSDDQAGAIYRISYLAPNAHEN